MNIFLEGASFTGKTTLLNTIKKNDSSLTIINEHDMYANGILNYPKFPSITKGEAIENVNFFYNIEQLRFNDADQTANFIFDRSIFSVILFQKYIQLLKLTNHYSAYLYAKKEAARLIKSNVVAVPDYLIYLSADYATVAGRYEREISVGLLRGETAHTFFQGEYAAISSIYEKRGRSLGIVSTNDKNSLNSQVDSITEHIKLWQRSSGESIDLKQLALEAVNII